MKSAPRSFIFVWIIVTKMWNVLHNISLKLDWCLVLLWQKVIA